MEPNDLTEGTTPQQTGKAGASKPSIKATSRNNELTELVDQIGPETARSLIDAAVLLYASESRAEVWRQRMEKTRRLYRINMMNLKHDFDALSLEWDGDGASEVDAA